MGISNRFFLVNLFFSFGFSSFAQQGNWDVYMAQYEKGVGSVMIDMELKKTAPLQNLPFVCITGVTFKKCTTDGMPENEEFNNLYRISDSVNAVIERTSPGKVQAATFTYQCERLDYYYVSDTIGLQANLQYLYSSKFQGYTPYINVRKDEKWQAYLESLYPSQEIMEYMKNQKVVSKLSEAGDKLDKARKVDHWIYFANEADRNCFIAYSKEHNFSIESEEKSGSKTLPYKLQISRDDKVSVGEISVVTLELTRQAEKCNGDYDGWETFVIK